STPRGGTSYTLTPGTGETGGTWVVLHQFQRRNTTRRSTPRGGTAYSDAWNRANGWNQTPAFSVGTSQGGSTPEEELYTLTLWNRNGGNRRRHQLSA
ncbi:hypothetical protein CEXT_610381, partial [Caerostris extrusa]